MATKQLIQPKKECVDNTPVHPCLWCINCNLLYPTAVICDYPVGLPSAVMVTDYSEPALVGMNITVIYPSGDTLTRANSTVVITCMANGQWEPSPWNVVTMSESDGI